MAHPALSSTAHRPWPIPATKWSLRMRWRDLAFLHWPVDPATVRPHVPASLELDLWQGRAWLGVVPFVMAQTRFRLLPKVPTAHCFPELNLRTYVRRGKRTGVWFFSLDAGSRLAVEGARLGFGLPYFHARLDCRRDDARVTYRSERRDRRGPPATFAASWTPSGTPAPAAQGTLEQWLVERYCLFAQRRGKLVVGEIAHPPWQVAQASCALETCDMARLLGLSLQGPPHSVLAADPIDVVAWSPTVVDTDD